MSTELVSLLSEDHHPRILVVGDVMLDCYLWGDVRLVAATGDDAEGRRIRDLLQGLDVPDDCVLNCPDRSTTLKQRLLGRTHSHSPQPPLAYEAVPPLGTRCVPLAHTRWMDKSQCVPAS